MCSLNLACAILQESILNASVKQSALTIGKDVTAPFPIGALHAGLLETPDYVAVYPIVCNQGNTISNNPPK
jgi:hypothetical protein